MHALRDLVTLTCDLLTLESRVVMPLVWSMPVPTLRCICLTFTELWRLQLSIHRQL